MVTETISSMLFEAIAELAHREDVRSVSCPFGDAALWKVNLHLGLEFRRVIPPLPSRHALAPFLGRYAACW